MFTPSEATSPVSRTRTGSSSRENRSTIFSCSTSENPPCMMSTWPGLVSPSCFGSTSCSHLSVGTLSEKTTARAELAGPTPISLSLSTSAASLPESSSVMSSASFFSVLSACLSGSSVAFFRRFSVVFARALCEERNALSRVYGNRRRSLVTPGALRLSQVAVSSSKTRSSFLLAEQRTARDGPRSRHLPPISLVTSGLILVRRM